MAVNRSGFPAAWVTSSEDRREIRLRAGPTPFGESCFLVRKVHRPIVSSMHARLLKRSEGARRGVCNAPGLLSKPTESLPKLLPASYTAAMNLRFVLLAAVVFSLAPKTHA